MTLNSLLFLPVFPPSFLSVSLLMTARLDQADEETPLLASEHQVPHKRKHTPIPWGQFAILLILQLAEPLTSQVINPFAPDVSSTQKITN